jgi:hypothetical protein
MHFFNAGRDQSLTLIGWSMKLCRTSRQGRSRADELSKSECQSDVVVAVW